MDRRKVLTGICGLGIAGIAGCSSGGDQSEGDSADSSTPSSSGGEEGTTTQTEEDTTPQSANVPVGEVVSDDTLSMVVRNVSRTSNISDFQEADQGNEFVVVRLVVKNITDNSDTNVSGLFQTRIKDSENYTYSSTIAGTDKAFQAGTLSPGEVARGDLYYEVPEDASGLTMQFDFSGVSLFDYNRVTIDLENQADSIEDLSQNLRVETYATGESAEFEGLEVTVNSVEYQSSIGSFTEASQGNEFAIVDITTTNNTDEEISVSSLLQMECKDGRGFSYSGSLTASSQLDQAYPQGSPLGPGETRRGKIAYEIPEDVETLYWTFEFSLFVDGFKTFWQLE